MGTQTGTDREALDRALAVRLQQARYVSINHHVGGCGVLASVTTLQELCAWALKLRADGSCSVPLRLPALTLGKKTLDSPQGSSPIVKGCVCRRMRCCWPPTTAAPPERCLSGHPSPAGCSRSRRRRCSQCRLAHLTGQHCVFFACTILRAGRVRYDTLICLHSAYGPTCPCSCRPVLACSLALDW